MDPQSTPTPQFPSPSIYNADHKGTGDIRERKSSRCTEGCGPLATPTPQFPTASLGRLETGVWGQNGTGHFPFLSLSPFSKFRLTVSYLAKRVPGRRDMFHPGEERENLRKENKGFCFKARRVRQASQSCAFCIVEPIMITAQR